MPVIRRFNSFYPFLCTYIFWLQICLSGLIFISEEDANQYLLPFMTNNWVSQLQRFPWNIYYGFIYQLSLIVFWDFTCFWDFNLNDHLNPPDIPEILLRWASGTSSTYGFLKLKPPELCLLMNTLLHHNYCCLWEGAIVPFTLCYLTFDIPVATWGPSVDWTKSSVTTLSLPSLRMQRCTTRRTFCSLRSNAKRWGSVRIGCKTSFSRDSLMMSLSLYPGRDNSCSRNSVELFILRNNHRTSFPSWNLPKFLHQPKRYSHAALGQWWQDGNLILRVLPKPGRKNMVKMEENQQSRIFQHWKNWDFFLNGA